MNPDNTCKEEILIPAQAIAGNGSAVTANLDTAGKGSWVTLRIALTPDVATGTGPTFSLLESDDTVATNFATITADRTDVDITHSGSVETYNVDMRGRKRYLRLSIDPGGTATDDDVTVSCVATHGNVGSGPSSQAEKVIGEGTVVNV